ncbi:MAG TPA: peptidylprolyl isomerase [Methylomirabilota bacterium]|nr:peptidylprolyl isomerase [Methylomirabilota bacterium]
MSPLLPASRAFRRLALSALLFLAAGSGAADGPGNLSTKLAELFDNPVLARGRGVTVRRSDLEAAFVAYKANLSARGQGLSEGQRLLREAQMLDRLVVTQLLTNRATAPDHVKARELADRFLADSKKAAPSEESFNRQLVALGLSPEQFQLRVYEQALSQAILERELKSKITVTDDEVKEFYETGTDVLSKLLQADLEQLARDANTTPEQLADMKGRIDEFKKSNLRRLEQPERVRVMHVLLATRDRESEVELPDDLKRTKRAQIDKLLERARAGEDFARLVQEFSEDRGLAQTKGEYTFSRNDPFVPEFKAAAFTLNPGQISDVVTTMFGYHIIKCLERIPAQKAPLDKVSEELKEFLAEQKLQRQMPDYFARLKADAGVEILEPKYRLSAPPDTDPRK